MQNYDLNLIHEEMVADLTISNEKKIFYEIIKRTLDIIFSLVFIVITLPVMIIACLLVSLESYGSPLYTQKRLGKNFKTFTLLKIRSMKYNAEEKTGAVWAQENDIRITKVGKVIRNTRIDELPQLFNILKGDMSFVGPRPERKFFYDKFEKDAAPGFYKRLAVKPGLTGLAQINGGYDIEPSQKLIWDIKYIKKRSILLDIKILIKTIGVVIRCEGTR